MSFKTNIKKISVKNYNLKCLITKILNFFSNNDKVDKSCIHPSVRFEKLRYLDKGYGNKIIVAKNSRLINCRFVFLGNNSTVIIGENCSLNNMRIWCEDDNNQIVIGQNTTINGESNFACIEGTSIEIGEDCMFSSYIHFRTGDSHSVIDNSDNRINQSKNISIGNHVWVGQNVFVGKGAKVSDNSILGACAVVTKKFDSTNVAIAGNPAKIIKKDINWKRERV